MEKHKLRVIGITYNQLEAGVYALILEEEEGEKRRVPIIIGYPEAQAIECRLQDVRPPRPLTHDIMAAILSDFNIRLTEVFLHRRPDGAFAADLIFEDSQGDVRKIDSRSSDAVALALRCGAPIYTSSALLEEAGFSKESKKGTACPPVPPRAGGRYSRMDIAELRRRLQEAVDSEKYEIANDIKREIEKRTSNEK